MWLVSKFYLLEGMELNQTELNSVEPSTLHFEKISSWDELEKRAKFIFIYMIHVYTVPDKYCIVTGFVPDRPSVYIGNNLNQYDFYIG